MAQARNPRDSAEKTASTESREWKPGGRAVEGPVIASENSRRFSTHRGANARVETRKVHGRRARERVQGGTRGEPGLQAHREPGTVRESEARGGQFGPSLKSSRTLRYNSLSTQRGKLLEKVPPKLEGTLRITLI